MLPLHLSLAYGLSCDDCICLAALQDTPNLNRSIPKGFEFLSFYALIKDLSMSVSEAGRDSVRRVEGANTATLVKEMRDQYPASQLNFTDKATMSPLNIQQEPEAKKPRVSKQASKQEVVPEYPAHKKGSSEDKQWRDLARAPLPFMHATCRAAFCFCLYVQLNVTSLPHLDASTRPSSDVGAA